MVEGMRGKTRVALCGVGHIGSAIGRLILEKPRLTLVGAVDLPSKSGFDLGGALGLHRSLRVTVSDNLSKMLQHSKPEVLIQATASHLPEAYPQISEALRNHVHVISTCEELSYPYIAHRTLAEKLDSLASKSKVVVLGTGINPGFIMDTLPIMLTTASQNIRSIKVTRIVNTALRRKAFQRKTAFGLTLDEFQRELKTGVIGHIGMNESVAMIASALECKLTRIAAEDIQPIIAEEDITIDGVVVNKGRIRGIRQLTQGFMNDVAVITLKFEAYFGAPEEYDAISIEGSPNITLRIVRGIHGDMGTAAVVVNSIPAVLEASPGLKTMKDLRIPRAFNAM